MGSAGKMSTHPLPSSLARIDCESQTWPLVKLKMVLIALPANSHGDRQYHLFKTLFTF